MTDTTTTSSGASEDVAAEVQPITPAPSPLDGQPTRDVERLQRALRDAGYHTGPIDGRLAYVTEAAIRGFQRDHGLPVTGQLDEAQARLLLGDDWTGDTFRVREVARHG